MDDTFFWVELLQSIFHILKVGEEDSDVNVPIGRNRAPILVGTKTGATVDPEGDVVLVKEVDNLFERFHIGGEGIDMVGMALPLRFFDGSNLAGARLEP